MFRSFRRNYSVVIAGLDPAIHLLRIKGFYAMDPRVKPGGDERGCAMAESNRPMGFVSVLASAPVLASFMLLSAASMPAAAQSVADFYKGKQIRVIVGSAAGDY